MLQKPFGTQIHDLQYTVTLSELKFFQTPSFILTGEIMLKQKIILGILCLSLSACATLTRGTHELVTINSEPVGAKAVSDIQSKNEKNTVDGYLGCRQTPCKINLPRKSTPLITVSKDGHESIKFKLISTNATSKATTPEGTIVAGIPPGSYGAGRSLSPNPVTAFLAPLSDTKPDQEKAP